MLSRKSIIKIAFTVILFSCCKSNTTVIEKEEEKIASGSTPVTLTSPIKGSMVETVELNAVSAFLLKSYVKSTTTGYLQQVNATLGKLVNKGDILFILKTKESQSLGNTISKLDTALHFNGVIAIKSPGTGYITQINYRAGDYVQDAEQMAVITDINSFVFLLDLPYELKPFLPGNEMVKLKLPDGVVLNGRINASMPTVDAVSQTQNYVISVNNTKQIPENLIAKVSLIKHEKSNTTSLLKSAILTNEVQSEFWIMQMLDSVTAVKVPIKKGLENATSVEILSPILKLSDKIVLTGNYGMPDTAKVTINQ